MGVMPEIGRAVEDMDWRYVLLFVTQILNQEIIQ